MFHFILGSLIGFLERPLVETAACLAERVCELVTSAYFDKNVCWNIKTVEMLKCSPQIPKHSHKRGELASKLSDSARARQGIEPWLRTRHWMEWCTHLSVCARVYASALSRSWICPADAWEGKISSSLQALQKCCWHEAMRAESREADVVRETDFFQGKETKLQAINRSDILKPRS